MPKTLAIFIITLLLAAFPSASRPIAAQTGLLLESTPAGIDVTLGLGQSQSQQLSIKNSSSQALQPLVYEAYAQQQATTQSYAGPLRVALPEQQDRVDSLLSIQANQQEQLEFLVYFQDQADLSAARQIADWNARGDYVYRTLTAHAEQRQRLLRQDIHSRGLRFQPLWAVNAILVQGQLSDAYALAAHAEVALVRANHVSAQLEPAVPSSVASLPSSCNPAQPDNPVCWNIASLGADRVWNEFGVRGQGIVVADNDTGALYTHPALHDSYRGHMPNGRDIHDYNWFDPQGLLTEPADTNGHGTHTLGTMIGAGTSVAQPAIGMAPGAKWIASQGCEGNYCRESDLILSAQWLLAPTDRFGQNPRPDLRPMIINNSWSGPGNDNWYTGYTAAWHASGILAVFAVGNGRPATKPCSSVGAPSDYSDVIAVGAVDSTDTVASFSRFGPSADGRIKPDFMAPGTDGGAGIYSSSNSSRTAYRFLQGTSMAAPHVAGAVALMWSANPGLIGDEARTIDILRKTAKPIVDLRCGGDPDGIPNNVYGYGRIDTFAAVVEARVDVPWLTVQSPGQELLSEASTSLSLSIDAAKVPGPGRYQARIQIFPSQLNASPLTIPVSITVIADSSAAILDGQLVDAVTGMPILGQVAQQGGQSVSTDSEGHYRLVLIPGIYTLELRAAGYVSAQLSVRLRSGMQRRVERMERLSARIQAAIDTQGLSLGFPQQAQRQLLISNTGQLPLHYQISIPDDEYGIWYSDEPGGPHYQWIDLPASASVLHFQQNTAIGPLDIVQDVRIYDWVYHKIYIGMNGVISFVQPLTQLGQSGRCMPDQEFPLYAIAPLRAQFDLSYGGQIRYGLIDQGLTLVVSYEDLVPMGASDSQRYSFQALISFDGTIVFQYKNIPALLNGMTAGVQHSPNQYQSLGCHQELAIREKMAIAFFPQVASRSWLSTENNASSPVLPGAEQSVPITFSWVRPGPRELRGHIEIISADPWQRRLVLPVSLRTLAAPYEIRFVDVRTTPQGSNAILGRP